MMTFQKKPERPEELGRRLGDNEQECEQLQTALEDSEQRVEKLAGENALLQNEKLRVCEFLRYLGGFDLAGVAAVGCH